MVAALTAMLALAGCAGRITPPYSSAEQARIDEYEKAAEQVLASREIAGPPPKVEVGSDPALMNAGHPAAYYRRRTGPAGVGRPGTIVVNRPVLADDYVAQAVLSHLPDGLDSAPFPLDLQRVVEYYATRI